MFAPRYLRAAALCMGVVLLGGCGEALTPPVASPSLTRDESAHFQTDSLSYVLRAGSVGHEAALSIVYTNRTANVTSFANCRGATDYRFEKWVDEKWVWVWSPVLPLCLSSPIVVPPGGSHTFSVWLFGGYPECNCMPRFAVQEISGLYRVAWRSGFGAAQETMPSAEGRISNRFVLTAAPR